MDLSKITRLFSRRTGGIRRRLLKWGLTLLGIALIANTLAGSIYTRRLIKQDAAKLQTEIATRVALEIEDFIRRKAERLLDFSASTSLYEMGDKEQRLLALLLLKNDRAFTDASILDGSGMEVLKISERRVYLPEELADQSDSAKFKEASKGGSYISPVYTSDKAEPYITIAVPLKTAPQEVVGVVSVEVNLKILWEVIGEIEFGHAGYAYLGDGRGNLIAHRDPSLVLKRTNLNSLNQIQEFLRNPLGADPSPGGEDQGIMGKRVLSTFAPVQSLEWAVVLEEPVDVALAELRVVERYAFLLLGVGIVLGALIIVWGSNRITAPIHELHHGVEVIGKGDLNYRVEIKTGDEIEQLAQEFNKMAGELQTSYSTLEQKVEQRTSELAALYDVTSAVNQSLELDTILQAVIKRISEIFHFDATRIFLLNPQGDQLQLRASFETHPEFWAQVRAFKIGQGVVGKVAETGESIIFEDALTDPRYHAMSHSKVTRQAGFSFFAVFPIKAKGGRVGTMVLLGQKPRQLTTEEQRLLTSMADQIGVALENAALFEQVRTRSLQLAALNTVAATVNQSLDLDVVLRESVEKVCGILGFDAGWIYVIDSSGQELHLRAHKGLSDEAVRSMFRREIGRGNMGRVIASGEPLVYEDIQTDPDYLQGSATRRAQSLGFRTLCNFPVKSKARILGVLNLANSSRRRLSSGDLELLGSIANEIGVGVENARLFEETAKGAQRLSALYTVTSTVNQSLELEGVLQEVIEKIVGIFHFDTMRIFIFNPKMDELHLRASFPPDREDISHVRMFRRGEGVVGRVADSGKAMIFEDARTDPEYLALSKTKTTQKGGFSFFAAFPVKAKQRSIGAIMCNSKVPLRLTLDEVQLIESMADQIGVAVENANLFYETRRKSSELEQANIELVEANRAKADFLAAMSHELRTPLNVIIGNADLIRDGMFGDLTEKQKIALEKILHYSETLLKLINDVLTLTRVEAQKASLKVSTFDVGEIIAHVQSYVEHLNRDGHLKVLWHVEPGLPPMTTDVMKLEEILQNLIGNAFKFTPKGRIEVRVQDLRGNGRIEFSVADTGIGIANHDLDKIFEQFHQLGAAHTGTYSGVGLGLNIVKRYVEMMEGKIRVESAPGRGSTFIFELPYSIQ